MRILDLRHIVWFSSSYGTYLPQGIYGVWFLLFVSGRTNKRHHHHHHWGTVGDSVCAQHPWRVMECGVTDMLFSRTCAATTGGTTQLDC